MSKTSGGDDDDINVDDDDDDEGDTVSESDETKEVRRVLQRTAAAISGLHQEDDQMQ